MIGDYIKNIFLIYFCIFVCFETNKPYKKLDNKTKGLGRFFEIVKKIIAYIGLIFIIIYFFIIIFECFMEVIK